MVAGDVDLGVGGPDRDQRGPPARGAGRPTRRPGRRRARRRPAPTGSPPRPAGPTSEPGRSVRNGCRPGSTTRVRRTPDRAGRARSRYAGPAGRAGPATSPRTEPDDHDQHGHRGPARGPAGRGAPATSSPTSTTPPITDQQKSSQRTPRPVSPATAHRSSAATAVPADHGDRQQDRGGEHGDRARPTPAAGHCGAITSTHQGTANSRTRTSTAMKTNGPGGRRRRAGSGAVTAGRGRTSGLGRPEQLRRRFREPALQPVEVVQVERGHPQALAVREQGGRSPTGRGGRSGVRHPGDRLPDVLDHGPPGGRPRRLRQDVRRRAPAGGPLQLRSASCSNQSPVRVAAPATVVGGRGSAPVRRPVAARRWPPR